MTRLTAAALAAGVGLGAAGCGEGEPPPAPGGRERAEVAEGSRNAPPPSNLRMAARLREVAERINPFTLRYRNDVHAAMLRARIEQGPAPAGLQLRSELAVQLLLAARYEEAIREFDAIEAELTRRGGLGARDRDVLETYKAIAWLRLGEQENCIRSHTSDSCLLPIREAGFHGLPRGSRGAIELYTTLLERDPGDVRARWLLNLAYMTLGEYPDRVPEPWRVPPRVFESDRPFPRFRDVAPAAGVAVVALSGGAVLEDLDGDGDLDVMASSWGPEDQLRYFANNRDGTFTERTSEAWLDGLLGGLNLIHADYDNDGHADVLVLRGAWLGPEGKQPNSLLRNLGDGRFEDVTEAAGVLSFHPTQTAGWADFDGDGWLDLFIGNESTGERHPCELYRNNGDGSFTDVAADVGLAHVGFVKAAVWGDVDDDGRPDLFLSRFNQPNVLFRNEGPGSSPAADGSFRWSFRDVTQQAGVQEPLKSFPAWFFDYDNDGRLDLLVGSFADFGGDALDVVVRDILGQPTDGDRCRLYRNRGGGRFEDVSEAAGIARVLLAMGANFGDLDNDGWLDVYFGTGEPNMSTLVPNVMLRNDEGRRFQDVTAAGGFGNIQKGHGVAFGDVDGDGDQDLYVTLGGAYSGDVYQNALFENPGHGNRFVTLRLVGTRANRAAIGARVKLVVESGDGKRREIHRVVGTGGSFGSSSLALEVGLGDARRIVALEVAWPGSGTRSRFGELPLDRRITIREGQRSFEQAATQGD